MQIYLIYSPKMIAGGIVDDNSGSLIGICRSIFE